MNTRCGGEVLWLTQHLEGRFYVTVDKLKEGYAEKFLAAVSLFFAAILFSPPSPAQNSGGRPATKIAKKKSNPSAFHREAFKQ